MIIFNKLGIPSTNWNLNRNPTTSLKDKTWKQGGGWVIEREEKHTCEYDGGELGRACCVVGWHVGNWKPHIY
jgi:hypothetical protein